MKFPGVVAVLCVVPSGLVLHIGITSCTFPPWTEMSKKNRYERYPTFSMVRIPSDLEVDTCFIRTLSIEVKWHSDNELNFCLPRTS